MESQQDEKKYQSAYEKAAENGIDPRCIPQKLIEDVPEGDLITYPNYSETEVSTWKTLYIRQMELLKGRVCDEYLEGVKLMNFSSSQIPSLRELSNVLSSTSNWTVARVPGLIHEENFFSFLRRRVFPSTDYIREPHEIDYTPAPDLFHDIFGHMPLLTNSNFSNFYQLFGQAALNAREEQHIYLEKLHWFTVEFGLIKKNNQNRIYGAGIISSKNEVEHSLSSKVEVIPFDIERIIHQEYEVWHLQPLLFVIESFKQLETRFKEWVSKENLI